MQFNTYTYAGAHIAAWLVNHPAPGAAALSETLHDYDVHEPAATTAQARALLPWAQRARTIFEASAVADKAQRADELLVAADCRPRLVSHGPGLPFHFHYAPVRTGLAARVKALTAAGLAHVIDDGAGSRLQVCSRAGLRHRLCRHLAQRAPPLLQHPVRQPGQRGQPPSPPAARTGALTTAWQIASRDGNPIRPLGIGGPVMCWVNGRQGRAPRGAIHLCGWPVVAATCSKSAS